MVCRRILALRTSSGHSNWQDEILRGLKRCDWFVVLLSPNAVNSMWVKREIESSALFRRVDELGRAPVEHAKL
jgi:hypothetical protein